MKTSKKTRAEKIKLLQSIADGKTTINALADENIYFLWPLENGNWEESNGKVWTEKQIEQRMKSRPKDKFITFNANVPKTWLFRNHQQTNEQQAGAFALLPNGLTLSL